MLQGHLEVNRYYAPVQMTCYNCNENGHVKYDCPKPKVSLIIALLQINQYCRPCNRDCLILIGLDLSLTAVLYSTVDLFRNP